jgi:predicted nucleic acid-binding protein
MKVLDSSVALKWVLPEPDSAQAIRLRDDFRNGTDELLAPDLFPIEIAHALTKAERQQRIAIGHAEILFHDVLTTCPALHSSVALVVRACEISSHFHHSVYDCLYIALAEQESCDLVTADAKLVTKFHSQFPFVTALT